MQNLKNELTQNVIYLSQYMIYNIEPFKITPIIIYLR